MVARINYWFDTGNARLKMRSELPAKADVVVIGGGIAGLSTLYHLLSRDIDAVLVEASDMGFRGTGRSNGVSFFPKLNTVDNMGKLYDLISLNNRLVRDVISNENIVCDFQQTGELQLSIEDISCKHQNIVSMKSGLPQLIKSTQFSRGFYIPSTNTFNAYQFLYGLCAVCELSGPKLFGNARVKRIDIDKDKIEVLIDDNRAIMCNSIVHCCEDLLPKSLIGHVHPEPLYGTCTQPFFTAGKPLPCPNTPIQLIDKDIRISFHYGRMFIDFFVDVDEWANITDLFMNKIGSYFNCFDKCNLEYIWHGNTFFTSDNYPLIGKSGDKENEFVNTAHGKYGLSYAMLGGCVVADYIEKKHTDINNIDLLSPQRF